MLWNLIRDFASIFVTRNGIPIIFLFGTEFREFASIFVPLYRIPSIFLFHGMVRNGIPRVFCPVEQPELRRNKPIVPSIPS